MGKVLTVVLCQMIIFTEHVLFNLQHTALSHAGRVATGFTFSVVQIVVLLFWHEFFFVYVLVFTFVFILIFMFVLMIMKMQFGIRSQNIIIVMMMHVAGVVVMVMDDDGLWVLILCVVVMPMVFMAVVFMVMMVAVRMFMMMFMIVMMVTMRVCMVMLMIVMMIVAFNTLFASRATAGSTHKFSPENYSISICLICMLSPLSTRRLWLWQCGHPASCADTVID